MRIFELLTHNLCNLYYKSRHGGRSKFKPHGSCQFGRWAPEGWKGRDKWLKMDTEVHNKILNMIKIVLSKSYQSLLQWMCTMSWLKNKSEKRGVQNCWRKSGWTTTTRRRANQSSSRRDAHSLCELSHMTKPSHFISCKSVYTRRVVTGIILIVGLSKE